MSAKYHPVWLPGRQYQGSKNHSDCISRDAPGRWQLKFIGSVGLGFSSCIESLAVFKDLISGVLFYGEFSSDARDVELKETDADYWGLWVIYPDKLDQFCHYIQGWKPNVWDTEQDERDELERAVRYEFDTLDQTIYEKYEEEERTFRNHPHMRPVSTNN